MKKLILLLIALTTFIYVSYASFPISDTLEVQQDIMQTEEIKQYHYSLQKMGVDLNSCKCVSCRGGIAPLVSKPKPLPIKTKNVKEVEVITEVEKRESNGNWYAFLSILSALGAIIFAFLTIGSALMHNAKYLSVITFLLLTLLSIGGTFFSALKAKKSGASWSKALLGVGIVVLLASFFLIGM
ncbi:MAG: hypothetical protein HN498_02320 [Flavobacteriales bacterium]|jgi:hypothetical protein|nr:hypothetical protein [Flavobacteriales bacterium]MBT5615519.1 hypothetical protein [Flavobacteriales bacterium]MBT6965884.1 hypothetical protein [Flavobacteriales bacterium]